MKKSNSSKKTSPKATRSVSNVATTNSNNVAKTPTIIISSNNNNDDNNSYNKNISMNNISISAGGSNHSSIGSVGGGAARSSGRSRNSSSKCDNKHVKKRPRTSREGEHPDDSGSIPIYLTRATRTYTYCAAINSCNLGYDIGMSTSAGEMIQQDMDLSDAARDLLVGSLHFWSIFGALASSYISDVYGRRATFVASASTIALGMTIMALGSNYNILMLGRMCMGLGVGCGLSIDPMYISEISPAKGRGEMVNWIEIGLNVGLVLGFSTGLFLSTLSDGKEWRIMFLLGTILPFLMIYLIVFVVPESPRWLMTQNCKYQARICLRKLYNRRINSDQVLDHIEESLARDTYMDGWNTLLFHPTPAIRRMLIVGIGLAIAQQAVGVDAIQHYMMDALNDTGIQSQHIKNELMILLSLVKISFIVVGGKAADIGGRRQQLFVSLIGMTVSLLVLSIVFYSTSYLDPRLTLFGLSLYLSFYSIGMGPMAWLIPAEIFPTRLRAKAMSIVTCMNRIGATLMAATFVLSNWMSWTTFYIVFAVICIMVTIFLYLFLPETKGRSLEDLTLYFAEITGDDVLLKADRIVQDSFKLSNLAV